ncbi:MAG: virulence factor [Candidatus Rokubacteria bacterium]|nr:virulence factor [Candidatus Rokubacteria bacterium]MBI4593384.1 virulence factor [Candidatus Rokubacteria bacterium]
MATYQIIAWRGIPASVEARDDRETATRQLSERFQMLIDSVAMLLGVHESDAYLEDWQRSEGREQPGSAAEVAAVVAAGLEERFPEFAAQAFRRP